MGPGLNPQYTGAPKAGGGCGLLINSTTTSPIAQPQCGNVNMVAEHFRSTARWTEQSEQSKQSQIKRGDREGGDDQRELDKLKLKAKESSRLKKDTGELTSDKDHVNAQLTTLWWSISTSLMTCALPRP